MGYIYPARSRPSLQRDYYTTGIRTK
jgi:hypothetical protein